MRTCKNTVMVPCVSYFCLFTAGLAYLMDSGTAVVLLTPAGQNNQLIMALIHHQITKYVKMTTRVSWREKDSEKSQVVPSPWNRSLRPSLPSLDSFTCVTNFSVYLISFIKGYCSTELHSVLNKLKWSQCKLNQLKDGCVPTFTSVLDEHCWRHFQTDRSCPERDRLWSFPRNCNLVTWRTSC